MGFHGANAPAELDSVIWHRPSSSSKGPLICHVFCQASLAPPQGPCHDAVCLPVAFNSKVSCPKRTIHLSILLEFQTQILPVQMLSLILFCLLLSGLGNEPRVSCMAGRYYTTELYRPSQLLTVQCFCQMQNMPVFPEGDLG